MTTPKDTWISVNPNIIGGIDVQVNNMLCVSKEMVQYRFPKSKKNGYETSGKSEPKTTD